MLGEQSFPGIDQVRVEPAPGHRRQRPDHHISVVRADLPGPLLVRQMRPQRLQRLPGHGHPLRQVLRRPNPRRRLTTRNVQGGGEQPGHGPLTLALRQASAGAFVNHLVIDQRQPVPQLLEALQEPDQPGIVQGLQPAVLNEFDQMVEVDVERVERLLDLPGIPDIHNRILLEHMFEHKQNHQENKGNPARPCTWDDWPPYLGRPRVPPADGASSPARMEISPTRSSQDPLAASAGGSPRAGRQSRLTLERPAERLLRVVADPVGYRRDAQIG